MYGRMQPGFLVCVGGLEGLCVLAQDVADEQVGQTACADAEEALLDVVLAKDFAYHGVEVYGFGCGFDATGSLEAYKRACEVVIFLDGRCTSRRLLRAWQRPLFCP